jgi:hypothetical protein
MALVSGGPAETQWDDVMFQIARWLARHLNDPSLILWIAQRGGQLDGMLLLRIAHELERLRKLEQEGDSVELARIRTNAPNAVPSPKMQMVWRLLLTDRIKSLRHGLDLYRWRERFKREGLNIASRLELRALLSPKVSLTKALHWPNDDTLGPNVDCEVVLASEHARRHVARDRSQHQLVVGACV